mmetsp:Transcript_116605/g.336819  ORF Transcript_116605/g.336819 Transcript_116605/m.336819 type:complete len:583 (-) Transcript_116605:127-1875(-)
MLRIPVGSLAMKILTFTTLAMMCLLVLATLRHFWRVLAQVSWSEGCYKTVVSHIRRICARAGGNQGVDPEVQEQVRESISSMQVQLARDLVPWACLLLTHRGAAVVCATLRGEPTGKTVAQDAGFLLTFLGTTVCTIWPRLMTARTMVLWHIYFMVFLYCISSPLTVEPGLWISVYQTKALGSTLAASFLCLKFPVLLVSNSLYCCASVLALGTSMPAVPGLPINEMMWQEVSFCVVKLAIFRLTTRLMNQSVHGEVLARAGACERSAVSSLLGMMCDAVLDLDQSLAMQAHVTKLAGMLMHGPGMALKGRPLVDFLASDQDRRRFEEAVARCIDEAGELQPMMLSVGLRDCIGNIIPAVLYHVPYRSLAGRMHHLVGLREDTDAGCEQLGEEAPPIGRVEMPEAVLTEAALSGVRRTARAPRSRTSVRSRSSGSSSSVGDEGELVVEVFAHEVLPISRVSARFGTSFGGAVGGSFRTFLHEDVGSRFAGWLCEESRRVASGEREPHIVSFGDLELATSYSGGTPRKVSFHAEVCFPKPLNHERQHLYLVGIRLTARRISSPPRVMLPVIAPRARPIGVVSI